MCEPHYRLPAQKRNKAKIILKRVETKGYVGWENIPHFKWYKKPVGNIEGPCLKVLVTQLYTKLTKQRVRILLYGER